MPIPSVTQFDPAQFFKLPSSTGGGVQRLDMKVGAIEASNDFSGRLTVTTEEGDKITLSANVKAAYRAGSIQSHAEGDGISADVNAHSVEYALTKEFNVTVEGDLNEGEIKDLTKLFRKVSNIFKKYINGQDDAALAKTGKLAQGFGNLSSLSGLDLSVDVERSVTVIAAQLAAEIASPAPAPSTSHATASEASSKDDAVTPGVAPSREAAIPPPSAGTTAPTQPGEPEAEPASASPVAASVARQSAGDQSFIDQVLSAVKDAKVEPHKLRKYLSSFLVQVLEDLKQKRGAAANTDLKAAPDVPTRTASAALFTYQATRQTFFSLSLHT